MAPEGTSTTLFDTTILSQNFFDGSNRVNSAATFNGGKSVIYGTDNGVYLQDTIQVDPVKVLTLTKVQQVDVLEVYQLLLVLADSQFSTFPLKVLDARDPAAGLQKGDQISTNVAFFKAGICLDRVMISVIKTSSLSTTFKVLVPRDHGSSVQGQPGQVALGGNQEVLKVFSEFYIPIEVTSVHYLKTKLCAAGGRGFEVIDLTTLDTQSLLDPADKSFGFVHGKKHKNLPMALYKVGGEFLVCYDSVAFYVNQMGQRSRGDFLIQWEGKSKGFAFHEPYLLVFGPQSVEVRHIESGIVSQAIQGPLNMELLYSKGVGQNDTLASFDGRVVRIHPKTTEESAAAE